MIATCLSGSSSGARILEKLDDVIVQELDITREDSIVDLKRRVQEETCQSDSEFYALVNNAGFMPFGEFEWFTPQLLRRPVEVNLLGTMQVTHALLPIMRRNSSGQRDKSAGSRIINVNSHCSLVQMPGLSTYSASKAGLAFHTNALRIELRKYNVKVVEFIPGSFVFQSAILSRHSELVTEMWQGLDEEQREFYGEYYRAFNGYLEAIARMAPQQIVDVDPKILRSFERAITATEPNRRYVVEPFRYKFYHTLFQILPHSKLRDDLIERFMQMPKYQKKTVDV